MGETITNKAMFAILSVLNRHGESLPSNEIAARLRQHGVDLSERTVRFYLKILEEKGHTEKGTRKGRRITKEGREELNRTFVSERVGFVINKINNLSVLTDFAIETGKGQVILNISYVPDNKLEEALRVLTIALLSPYSTSNRIIIGRAGEQIGHMTVPQGMVGIGTVCSITLNGVFLKAGIPVHSRFGGVVEVIDNEPSRFVSIVSYEGSSVAPLEVFMKGKMTDVLGTLRHGRGNILGSFREIPEISLGDAKELNRKMNGIGFGGIILFGQPGQPLLGVPVTPDKVGMVILGGLNPVAALEEADMAVESLAMATLCDYSLLSPVDVVEKMCFPEAKPEKALMFDHLYAAKRAGAVTYWSVFEGLKQSTL
jgi:repressor of nif and glnA expression